MPINITGEMCGHKKNFKGLAANKARQHLLERLRLRSPALPLDLHDSWPRFKRTWSQIAAERYGEMTGHKFVTRVNECLEALACHYQGNTSYNKPWKLDENNVLCWKEKRGDPAAFEKYLRECWALLPTSTVSAFM